eukprot:4512834-Prymnesium_polylepis.1
MGIAAGNGSGAGTAATLDQVHVACGGHANAAVSCTTDGYAHVNIDGSATGDQGKPPHQPTSNREASLLWTAAPAGKPRDLEVMRVQYGMSVSARPAGPRIAAATNMAGALPNGRAAQEVPGAVAAGAALALPEDVANFAKVAKEVAAATGDSVRTAHGKLKEVDLKQVAAAAGEGVRTVHGKLKEVDLKQVAAAAGEGVRTAHGKLKEVVLKQVAAAAGEGVRTAHGKLLHAGGRLVQNIDSKALDESKDANSQADEAGVQRTRFDGPLEV